MKSKHRNPPLVLHPRSDLAIGAFIGDHFPAPVEPDEGSVETAGVLFEFRSVAAAGQPFETACGPMSRHALAAAEFDVIAARELEPAGMLVPVQPPGDIHLMAVRGV